MLANLGTIGCISLSTSAAVPGWTSNEFQPSKQALNVTCKTQSNKLTKSLAWISLYVLSFACRDNDFSVGKVHDKFNANKEHNGLVAEICKIPGR